MAISQGEWQRQRLQNELARGLHSPTGPVARFLAHPTPKQPPSRAEIDQAARAGERLVFDGKSSCFSHLSWSRGEVYAVFWNGYSYSAPLDKGAFLDWTADSAGKFFNDVLGRDFFASKSKDAG